MSNEPILVTQHGDEVDGGTRGDACEVRVIFRQERHAGIPCAAFGG